MGNVEEPTDKRLLKSQQNLYLPLVVGIGLNPSEFEWKINDFWERHYSTIGTQMPKDVSYKISILEHQPSEFFFKFGPLTFEFSPAETCICKRVTHEQQGESLAFAEWLKALKREVNAPDLWSALQDKHFAEISGANPDDSAFTISEKQQMRLQLDEIKTYLISTGQVEGERLNSLDEKLDYLVDAADRVTRKDWKVLLIGVLCTVVLNFCLGPEQTGQLLVMASQAFAPVLQFITAQE